MLYFALDLSGASPEAKRTTTAPIVTGLPTTQGQVIVAPYGVFYPESLVVRHVETDTELVRDKDYYLTYVSRHFALNYDAVGMAGIVLTNKTLTGTVESTAQYVGGGYVRFNPTYVLDVVDLINGKPPTLDWDNVIDAPAKAHPNSHKLPAENIATGYQDYVATLHHLGNIMTQVAQKQDLTRIPIGAKVTTVLPNNKLNQNYWVHADGQELIRTDYPVFFETLEIVEDTFTLPTEANTYIRIN